MLLKRYEEFVPFYVANAETCCLLEQLTVVGVELDA